MKKVKAVQENNAANSTNNNDKSTQLKLQDKENISSLFDMQGGSVKREIIESMYLKNGKDFDKTLDQLLSGAIPKDEYQVVVIKDN